MKKKQRNYNENVKPIPEAAIFTLSFPCQIVLNYLAGQSSTYLKNSFTFTKLEYPATFLLLLLGCQDSSLQHTERTGLKPEEETQKY